MLLIASRDSGLPNIDGEIQSAVNLFGAELLISEPTISSISDRLSGSNYKILWIAGHGGPEGIEVSPGKIITANELAPCIRGTNVELIVINSCNSETMAYALHAETNAAVVYTESNVSDAAAFSTAKSFIGHISRGASYGDAYIKSRSRHFRMMGGNIGSYAAGPSELHEAVGRIKESYNSLDRRVVVLETSIGFLVKRSGEGRYSWIAIAVGVVASASLFLYLMLGG